MSVKLKTEKDIQIAILKHLKAQGIFCWRHNANATYMAGNYYKYAGMVSGIADIVAILPPNGTVVMFEVKKPTGKPSEEQVMIKRRVEGLGGKYFFVRSVEEVREALSTVR